MNDFMYYLTINLLWIVNIKTSTGSVLNPAVINYATQNPFRYRGYYYDNETGFYYLNSRYYDPIVKRFINADSIDLIVSTPLETYDNNLYNYCDNNPISRKDKGGEFWDTVFDVISLVGSVAEVVVNPTDPYAWAGLAADALCTITPGLTGGGTIVRAITKSDKVLDTAKQIYKVADKTSDIKKATGSYEILYKSGKNYVGKGGFGRALSSAKIHALKGKDEVISINWKPAKNKTKAFIDEYVRMAKRGVNNSDTYNKIWSPGRQIYYNKFNLMEKRGM